MFPAAARPRCATVAVSLGNGRDGVARVAAIEPLQCRTLAPAEELACHTDARQTVASVRVRAVLSSKECARVCGSCQRSVRVHARSSLSYLRGAVILARHKKTIAVLGRLTGRLTGRASFHPIHAPRPNENR